MKLHSERIGESCAVRIDKLAESSFQVWKQIMNLILTYRKVDDVAVEQDLQVVGIDGYRAWAQRNKQA